MDDFLRGAQNVCLIALGIGLLLFAIVYVFKGFKYVPEGELWVIVRLTGFARVVTAGLVWIAPWFERVTRRIDVSPVVLTERFTNIWLFGFVPATIEVYLSYQLQLVHLPYPLQRQLVLRDRAQWKQAIISVIKAELSNIFSDSEYKQLLSREPNQLKQLHAQVREQLENALQNEGVALNQYQDVKFSNFDVEPDIRKALTEVTRADLDLDTRLRMMDQLKHKYPNESELFLIAMAGLITGRDVSGLQMMPSLLISGGLPSVTSPAPPPPRAVAASTVAGNLPPQYVPALASGEWGDPEDAIWDLLRVPTKASSKHFEV